MYVLVYNRCLIYYVTIIKINQVCMKKYLLILLLAGALVLSACGTTKDNKEKSVVTTPTQESKPIVVGNYLIDTENSKINWHAEKFIGKAHDGTVKIKSGEVSFNNDSSKGTVIIDMTTITESENTTQLINHLKSADFFDVTKFPESKIELTKIVPTKDGINTYEVFGNLTIKDKTNPIAFNAVITGGSDTATLNGKFSIDRTLWNVKFGSNKFFDNLADKAIRDDIDYNISISAKLIK